MRYYHSYCGNAQSGKKYQQINVSVKNPSWLSLMSHKFRQTWNESFDFQVLLERKTILSTRPVRLLVRGSVLQALFHTLNSLISKIVV